MSLVKHLASKMFTSGTKNPIVEGMGRRSGSALQVLSGVTSTNARTVAELLKAYNTSPWLRAAVNKISYATASTPWRLYVAKNKAGDKIKSTKIQKATIQHRKKFIKEMHGKGELEEIHNHPILDLLTGGNEFITGLVNFQILQMHLDLVGEGFLLKERNGLNKPSSLWAIPPIWVKETPYPGREYFTLQINGVETDIPMEEIMWFKDPNPADPFGRGSGVARALADELDADEFASKHIKDFFYNGARPDILVTADGLEKGETERLEAAWNSRLKGFFKNYRTFFLNKKVDVHELHASFKDSQMVELRKFERDAILQVYGMPPEIMGIIESSNRATIEAADYIFASKILVPRLENQRAVFQERLIPDFDERLILDYESPIADNKEFMLEVMKATPHAFDLDEIRDLAGASELADEQGKARYIAFNLLKVEEDGSTASRTNSTADPTDPVVDDENKSKSFTKAITNREIEIIVNEVTKDPFVQLVLPVVEQTAIKFGQDTIDDAGVDLVYDNLDPRVDDFINTQTGERFENLVNDTTKNKLRDELREGISLNETEAQLSKRIQNVFTDATDNRARMIARTETVRASNYGAFSGMQQAGVEEKEWLSSRDSRVRDSHIGLDGTTIPINAVFVSPETGNQADFPGNFNTASEDIDCRCTVLSVFDTKDEKVREARWKAFDTERLPFETLMERNSKLAFREQEVDVLDKFEELFRSNP